MAIKPITGMLRRGLFMDLSIGLGLGFAMTNLYWYGYHMPNVHARDKFYSKLEEERKADI